MSLMNVFEIAGSAMSAQSQRLNAVASNLANAESVTGPNGQPYRAKQVVFSAVPIGASGTAGSAAAGSASNGVAVTAVVEDASPGRKVYDPKHPMADAQGYITMPNVNAVEEMVNMIAASRAYQNNIEMLNTAKTLMLKTLTLGQ
ncbi:MAG: flagellar basal body rod protein FlgC [Proteobacteria bacterium]|nr:flagellar basal body rod protein FlgC [Pseudomonadota bacterium]